MKTESFEAISRIILDGAASGIYLESTKEGLLTVGMGSDSALLKLLTCGLVDKIIDIAKDMDRVGSPAAVWLPILIREIAKYASLATNAEDEVLENDD